MLPFTTMSVPDQADETAPDDAEIRLLPRMQGGSLCHCTFPEGAISRAVRHRTIDEIWYFLEGQGEVWRSREDFEAIVPVQSGVSLTIPVGISFQIRNTGTGPLTFLCFSMPPWPGDAEAIQTDDYWKR
jgi:mannose-6-phosphate isomerase-like protein (cupin superfamily)